KAREECERWLSPPDPLTTQNEKRRLCHPGTNDWFIHGNTSGEWAAGHGSLLWLHGKPGSGKSVLCSTIVEHVQHLRRIGLATSAYFYCDFQDSKKQTFDSILRSVLLQLCEQSNAFSEILSRLCTLYDSSLVPTDDELELCLNRMLELPKEAPKYIIVDALDECSNSGSQPRRGEILRFLRRLSGYNYPDVYICVTSRPEADIESILRPLACSCINLEKEMGQAHGISKYIQESIENHPGMQEWAAETKDLVVKTLTRNADGM
ncbi:hypothetical protein BC834DRAFT_835631, partial [Gloeopeniophorella convolvens]